MATVTTWHKMGRGAITSLSSLLLSSFARRSSSSPLLLSYDLHYHTHLFRPYLSFLTFFLTITFALLYSVPGLFSLQCLPSSLLLGKFTSRLFFISHPVFYIIDILIMISMLERWSRSLHRDHSNQPRGRTRYLSWPPSRIPLQFA